MIHITVIEDNPSHMAALTDSIGEDSSLCVRQTASTLADAAALERIPGDLWLVDLGLPDGNGVELIAPLVQLDIKVLAVTAFNDEANVLRAISMGVSGYLVKGTDRLLDVIHDVIDGHAPLTPSVATYLLKRVREGLQPVDQTIPTPKLSRRELETLEALAQGHSYREIAQLHHVTHHTVGDHIKSIYKKLTVNSKTAAVHKAVTLGLINLS